MRVLALDIGSSSVKAGYWDGRRFAARSRAAYPTHFDGPRAQVDPAQMLRALTTAARQAVGGRKVDALAYCTFSSGVIVTDHDGTPRTPIITHQDRRSTDAALALAKALGKRWLLRHTGNLPYPGGIGSSTLAWLHAHQPHTLLNDPRVGQVSSFVGHHLTGEWTIDRSNAVFLGLLDIHADAWSRRACAAVGVPRLSLPRLVWADEPWGTLTAAAARDLSLTAGLPVLGGFVDTSAAVIQTPMHAGQLAHSAGSTDVLAMSLPAPAAIDGILSRPVGVGRPGGPFANKSLWLAVRTIAAAGSSIAWLRRELFRDLSDRRWQHLLANTCAAIRHPPADQLAVQCDPAFAGDRASIAAAAGATLSGLTLASTREDLLAALLQALVRQSATNFYLLHALHRPGPKVYIMGGAADLAAAMHAAWPGKRTCERLTGDSLRGLVTLAAG